MWKWPRVLLYMHMCSEAKWRGPKLMRLQRSYPHESKRMQGFLKPSTKHALMTSGPYYQHVAGWRHSCQAWDIEVFQYPLRENFNIKNQPASYTSPYMQRQERIENHISTISLTWIWTRWPYVVLFPLVQSRVYWPWGRGGGDKLLIPCMNWRKCTKGHYFELLAQNLLYMEGRCFLFATNI